MPSTQGQTDEKNRCQSDHDISEPTQFSVIIPARNEGEHIALLVSRIRSALQFEDIVYQLIVVDDNSIDDTYQEALRGAEGDECVRVINRRGEPGFGRAVRFGLTYAEGTAVAVFMGDGSDDCDDLVRCYRKIAAGYDAVFGSRFARASSVEDYPVTKLILNRVANRGLQWLFWTKHDDLTNAFKVYRASVIAEIGPFTATGFNLTLEMALSALTRGYKIARLPIQWRGRGAGTTKFSIRHNLALYLYTVVVVLTRRKTR